jgi:hypothetical protein
MAGGHFSISNYCGGLVSYCCGGHWPSDRWLSDHGLSWWLCLDFCWGCWSHWLKLHHWSVDGGSAGLLGGVEDILRLFQVGESDVDELSIEELLLHLHLQTGDGLHVSTESAVASGETSPKVSEKSCTIRYYMEEKLGDLIFISNSVELHSYPRKKTILM